MSTDPVTVAAEWIYERDWRARYWPSEEAMRPRPTFAQLVTGETCLPPSFARAEVAEGKRRIADAETLLDLLRPIIEAELHESIEAEVDRLRKQLALAATVTLGRDELDELDDALATIARVRELCARNHGADVYAESVLAALDQPG